MPCRCQVLLAVDCTVLLTCPCFKIDRTKCLRTHTFAPEKAPAFGMLSKASDESILQSATLMLTAAHTDDGYNLNMYNAEEHRDDACSDDNRAHDDNDADDDEDDDDDGDA